MLICRGLGLVAGCIDPLEQPDIGIDDRQIAALVDRGSDKEASMSGDFIAALLLLNRKSKGKLAVPHDKLP